MIVESLDHAYGAVNLALAMAREPVTLAVAARLTEDQIEEIDRHLTAAKGALTMAYQVAHGVLPDDVLAAEQERIRNGP